MLSDHPFKNKPRNSIAQRTLLRARKQAMRAPYVYQVANSILIARSPFMSPFTVFLFLMVLLYSSNPVSSGLVPNNALQSKKMDISNNLISRFISMTKQKVGSTLGCESYKYNPTYPITAPVKGNDSVTYSIGIISDLDSKSKNKKSKKKKTWSSYYIKGRLNWISSKNLISISWNKDAVIYNSSYAFSERGMELSELVTYDGRLLTFEDKTGVIYYIEGGDIYPWIILVGGNGKSSKGFKAEWATMKDNLLYVGSHGRVEATSSGEFTDHDQQWIKIIAPPGEVVSHDWTKNYEKIQEAVNMKHPGYIIHEAVTWSNVHKKWFFLPRKCSTQPFDEDEDEERGCNLLISVDETFTNIKAVAIGKQILKRGFSSFKFLPGTGDSVIIGIRTIEVGKDTATYILAFNFKGEILMPESKVSDLKFEGFEFI